MRSTAFTQITQTRSAPTRDRELVRFVARFGAVDVAHVMRALHMGRTAAYRRIGHLRAAGLLERVELMRREPPLIRATREGLRYAGMPGMPVAVVRPGGADHYLGCATVAQHLQDFGDGSHDGNRVRFQVITERELALAERIEGRPLASARFAMGGHDALHRPDLALLDDAGVVAIEVELSAKAPRRLEAIMRGWRRARHVEEVHYYCSPAARRAVERAIERTYVAEKVRLREMPR